MSAKTLSFNGSFDVFYRAGWAHLEVRPPSGGGRPVYPDEVENRMRLLGVPRVPAKVVRGIVEAAEGVPTPLVEWPAGSALAASIAVEIAADGMGAAVTVGAPRKGGAAPAAEDVLDELARAGVVHGIDRDAVEAALAKRVYGKPFVAAAGTPPVPGKAARVVCRFQADRGKPYLEMAFGRINLRELNFVENRRAGELLAVLEPAAPARDGRRVDGAPLRAEPAGDDQVLRAGKNVRLSDDGTEAYAEVDGNARLQGGTVVVDPVLVVAAVDYGTGNLRFDGSVVIEGGIADGFAVEAGGDVQVGGGVGKATIRAGGNVVLKTGINGNGEGRVECGGDLFAKYLESCSVACRGNVFAEEAVMHSTVAAGRHCVLNGRRSEVIASEVVAGGCLWCKKLGNFNEAPTRVFLGADPDLFGEYRAAASGLEARQTEWDTAERQAEQLEKLLRDGRDDAKVRQALIQVRGTLDRLGGELAGLRSRLPRLRERLNEAVLGGSGRNSFAVVEEAMFPGAVVAFGLVEYRPPSAGIRKVVLRVGSDSVVEGAFNFRDRPSLDFTAPSQGAAAPIA